MKKIFLLILLSTFLCNFLSAQTLVVNVNKTKIGIDDVLELTYTIRSNNATCETLKIPIFKNFITTENSKKSTKTNFLNGKTIVEKTATYYLKPKTTGIFTIERAALICLGKAVYAEPIKVEVLEGTTIAIQEDLKQIQENSNQDTSDLFNFLNENQDAFKIFDIDADKDTENIFQFIENFLVKQNRVLGLLNDTLDNALDTSNFNSLFKNQNPSFEANNHGKTNLDGIEIDDNVFITTEISNSNPKIGEAVIVTYKLLTPYRIGSFEIIEQPQISNATVELFKNRTPKIEKENIEKENLDGIDFNTQMIAQYVITPTQTGAISINPITIVARLQKSNTIFKKETKILTKSNITKINVKPIVLNNEKQLSVGNFEIDAKISSKTIKLEESPLKLKIIITGKGNFTQIKDLKIIKSNNLSISEPQITNSWNLEHANLVGEKTFEYALTGLQNGIAIIEPIEFEYFDTVSNAVKKISTDKIELNILKK